MNSYHELELSILSCLLQRPELMKEIILEDEHFTKYRSLWLFMKSFYKKFGTFDLELMLGVINDKYKFIDYIELLIDREPAPSLFEKYQQTLIDFHNQSKEEKKKIEEVYILATELYFNKIDFGEFKERIIKIIS